MQDTESQADRLKIIIVTGSCSASSGKTAVNICRTQGELEIEIKHSRPQGALLVTLLI